MLRAIPSTKTSGAPLRRRCRNPTVLLKATPSERGAAAARRLRTVAIQPHCSGQFQVPKIETVNDADAYVAIPPYCSGQFQGKYRGLVTGEGVVSQSRRTAQGNSKSGNWAHELMLLGMSQSHRTAQGKSKETKSVFVQMTNDVSQSHRAAQGNSKVVVASLGTPADQKSQSHRTAQGNSKTQKEQAETLFLYLSQSHRTVQGDSGRSRISSACLSSLTCRNPTLLLRANSKARREPGDERRRAREDVAIPPYCSGQFPSARNSPARLQQGRVAIQPHCSGQFQVNWQIVAFLIGAIVSQSHRTARGNSTDDPRARRFSLNKPGPKGRKSPAQG